LLPFFSSLNLLNILPLGCLYPGSSSCPGEWDAP